MTSPESFSRSRRDCTNKRAAALKAAIKRARNNPEDFAELLMTSERTGESIDLAAHQRIGIRFMHENPRSVNIWPIDHAKTFTALALIMWMIGKYPTSRGAIVSATQQQAAKVLQVIKSYIDRSSLYRNVFGLERGDKWTDTQFTVKRRAGIKDPTCIAWGLDAGGVPGARLDWILCDDILNAQNTRTKEQRQQVSGFLASTLEARLEKHDWARFWLTNSAWHPEDALHEREKLGWATLRMQVDGHILIKDDIERKAQRMQPWDHPLLYPVDGGDGSLGERLRIKAPRHDTGTALWPERYPEGYLEKLQRRHPIALEFNRLYMSMCRDDESAMCKNEWIELCKENARKMGYLGLTQRRPTTDAAGRPLYAPRFTGVDLAFSEKDASDDCAIFTIEILPTGHRLLLDVQIGKWDGPTMVDKLIDVHTRYDSIITVENNAGQKLLLQFFREKNLVIPLKAFTTGRNKAHPEFGVQSIFTEIANGAWLIPNDKNGNCHPMVQKWIDGCLYYTPAKHTADALMACWFAREQARKFGALVAGGDTAGMTQNIAATIMSR